MILFPPFFSGASGSLTSLFFFVMLIIFHLCARSDIRGFVKAFGPDHYTLSHDARREYGFTSAVAYGLGTVALAMMSGLLPETVFGLVVWFYGWSVAYRGGEALALKIVAQKIKEMLAREALGLVPPPPVVVMPPAPVVVVLPPQQRDRRW